MPFKDPDKRREYTRQYRSKHKDKFSAYMKIYGKKYRSENKEKTIKRHRDYYYMNKDKISIAEHNRYIKRRNRGVPNLIYLIKLHYKCCNSDCLWLGELLPCMLDFHHLNVKEKHFGIATMAYKAKSIQELNDIINEINKCTVLCAMCHRLESCGFLDASKIQPCNIKLNITDSDLNMITILKNPFDFLSIT